MTSSVNFNESTPEATAVAVTLIRIVAGADGSDEAKAGAATEELRWVLGSYLGLDSADPTSEQDKAAFNDRAWALVTALTLTASAAVQVPWSDLEWLEQHRIQRLPE